MNETSPPDRDDGTSGCEDWGAPRGYRPAGRTPASCWPSPPEAIGAPALGSPTGRGAVPAVGQRGSRAKLTALLASFRGRRKRS